MGPEGLHEKNLFMGWGKSSKNLMHYMFKTFPSAIKEGQEKIEVHLGDQILEKNQDLHINQIFHVVKTPISRIGNFPFDGLKSEA